MCLLVWLLSDDRGCHILSSKVQCQQNFLNLVNEAHFPFVQKLHRHHDFGLLTFTEELAAAKLALEHAVTQQNLTHAIAEQAQVFVEEAVQNRVQVQEVLATTHCSRANAVNPIGIAFTDAAIEVMEVTAFRERPHGRQSGQYCILSTGPCRGRT
jgi:hypothetical protein